MGSMPVGPPIVRGNNRCFRIREQTEDNQYDNLMKTQSYVLKDVPFNVSELIRLESNSLFQMHLANQLSLDCLPLMAKSEVQHPRIVFF